MNTIIVKNYYVGKNGESLIEYILYRSYWIVQRFTGKTAEKRAIKVQNELLSSLSV